MSGFKNFAVAGVGRIGEFIAEELLKLKSEGRVSSVIILTHGRTDATVNKLSSLGGTITSIDWSSPSSITAALTAAHVDVVISALPETALHLQHTLADAAKAANVKLLLPSEWGSRSMTREDGTGYYSSGHQEIHKKLEEIGLPYALVFTGMWSDFIFNPMFGWNIPNGKVEIWGEGNKPSTFTTRRDAARFVAHIVTALSPEELFWKEFCLEGDRKSLNDICEGYQAKTKKKLEIVHHPISEQEKILEENAPISVPFIVAWGLLA
ncbi:NAD(P)-binding protein [Neolentinus lepideus HHB14362 ss-1]|uniref:NAD(P)-binding protein n=1 Tax=Neolentinus lepideus HHB14362 ss-1 TaxID=1314782 RepID=A0A165SQD1_9AGAM|nr:NAD(P)-binding protein [Neolentinus lepideus HHB14362 ss-1]